MNIGKTLFVTDDATCCYKKIRIDWISHTYTRRQDMREQQLKYFMKMIEKSEKYGMLEK